MADEFKVIKTKDGKNIKVKIDSLTCIGAASCLAIAPNTFALNEKNIAYLIEHTEFDDLDTILAGAMSCPTQAITIIDETGKQLYPEVK